MLEKELTLKPLISGFSQIEYAHKAKGTPYYEQIVLCDGEYPVAMVHIDLFWPGARDKNPEMLFDIYDRLLDGETVMINVKMTIVEDE